MHLDLDTERDRQPAKTDREQAVPIALDWRVVVLVLVLSALAASLNVPFGGIPVAGAAFAILACGGLVGHVVGERRIRRITAGLVERWADAGARIEGVSRSNDVSGTAWTVHTSNGPVIVRGLALAPISKVTIEWRGMGDAVDASEAADQLDRLADEWFQELVEFS